MNRIEPGPGLAHQVELLHQPAHHQPTGDSDTLMVAMMHLIGPLGIFLFFALYFLGVIPPPKRDDINNHVVEETVK